MGKKIALVQYAASAVSTACVFFGQGPSSKVSTTSPSRRKSWVSNCSDPKPGPPVVSTSTTRLMPSALGLPSHEDTASTGGYAGGGGAWVAIAVGAVAPVPDALVAGASAVIGAAACASAGAICGDRAA